MSASLVSLQTSLLGLQMAVFSLSPHRAFSPCTLVPDVSSSCNDTCLIGSEPHPYDFL